MTKKSKTSEKKKLSGGLEKIPAPKVKRIGKNLGLLTTPVHLPEQNHNRLPDDPAEYSCPAYPGGLPESPQEALVKRLRGSGLTTVRIAIATGLKMFTVYRILGLDMDTKAYEIDTQELAQWYKV